MANLNIKQHDIKDCGAACLASIGNHFKVNLPIARIRQFVNTIITRTILFR
jgi:ABC-type bacteriocin/lantibiotic exporter with double-glycine peptidase domain